jgi:hypothetical protein
MKTEIDISLSSLLRQVRLLACACAGFLQHRSKALQKLVRQAFKGVLLVAVVISGTTTMARWSGDECNGIADDKPKHCKPEPAP